MAKKQEMVQIPREDFDVLMSRIEAIEKRGTTSEEILVGEQGEEEYFCRIKEHEGRPVTRIEDVVQKETNEKGEAVMTCTVITRSSDGHDVEFKGEDYAEFIRRDAVPCKLLETKIQDHIEKGPVVDEKIWNDDTRSMVVTGRKVRLSSKYQRPKFLVAWKNEKIWLDDINL